MGNPFRGLVSNKQERSFQDTGLCLIFKTIVLSNSPIYLINSIKQVNDLLLFCSPQPQNPLRDLLTMYRYGYPALECKRSVDRQHVAANHWIGIFQSYVLCSMIFGSVLCQSFEMIEQFSTTQVNIVLIKQKGDFKEPKMKCSFNCVEQKRPISVTLLIGILEHIKKGRQQSRGFTQKEYSRNLPPKGNWNYSYCLFLLLWLLFLSCEDSNNASCLRMSTCKGMQEKGPLFLTSWVNRQ